MSSSIEWTDETWNPTVGCSRVSPGCDGCYAIGVAHRAMQPAHEGLTERRRDDFLSEVRTDWTGEVRLLPDRLETPLHWRKPRRVFVDSMSDLFHPDVPESFVDQVFAVMAVAREHTFQVLTKRPQHMAKVLNGGTKRESIDEHMTGRAGGFAHIETEDVGWPLPNVWLGTSVENQRYADLRIPHLLAAPAAVRFLSIEPLLGPVVLRDEWLMPRANLCGTKATSPESQHAIREIVKVAGRNLGWTGIDWVIVGGESGPGARPMHPQWVRDIRDQCVAAGVPFFFKQWGEYAPWLDDTKPSVLVPWRDDLAGEHHAMVKVGKKAAGRELDGRTWDEQPLAHESLRGHGTMPTASSGGPH